mmetsp:Transcript_3768/g.3154  ORF Transcript_3768/g.3154 Transcript_3768/m.3154 type:complete len:105 (-) Transcript_3768:5-319(-)
MTPNKLNTLIKPQFDNAYHQQYNEFIKRNKSGLKSISASYSPVRKSNPQNPKTEGSNYDYSSVFIPKRVQEMMNIQLKSKVKLPNITISQDLKTDLKRRNAARS